MKELISELMKQEAYSMGKKEKEALLSNILCKLTKYHYDNCEVYKKMLDGLGYNEGDVESYYDLPMLPIRLFKEYELYSVDRKEIKKIMTSSGTTGQKVSKVFLDSDNTRNQTKALSQIVKSYIGESRQPMIILDTSLVKTDRTMFSARGAGIIGFSVFGRDIVYALDENMELNVEALKQFVDKHKDEKIVLFGYTYMIWQYVVNALKNMNTTFDIKDGVLFHVGGWKKLQAQSVDAETYNKTLRDVLGNVTIHNYYGMAEQLGSIYVECECGHMHCSNFSDIIIRRSKDFSVADVNEAGIIELVSVLPTSYPGHIILTEDMGEVLGEDDCACGRKGKYFKIHGRMKNAEIRGCSDTYERK